MIRGLTYVRLKLCTNELINEIIPSTDEISWARNISTKCDMGGEEIPLGAWWCDGRRNIQNCTCLLKYVLGMEDRVVFGVFCCQNRYVQCCTWEWGEICGAVRKRCPQMIATFMWSGDLRVLMNRRAMLARAYAPGRVTQTRQVKQKGLNKERLIFFYSFSV